MDKQRARRSRLIGIATIMFVIAAIIMIAFVSKDDPLEKIEFEAGDSLSEYVSKSDELKAAKVELHQVIVRSEDDIQVEFSAHDGKVFCRMTVDTPNKSVPRYHVIEWEPDKTDDARSVAKRLGSGDGLGCVEVVPMLGFADAGKIKDDVSVP